MKVSDSASGLYDSEGFGLFMRGSYEDVQKCMSELSLPEFSHIRTAESDPNLHFVYFTKDVSNNTLAEAEFAAYQYGLDAGVGHLSPSLYGWGNLFRKIGWRPLIRDNWLRMLVEFLMGFFLLGNNGYGKNEATVLTVSYFVTMFGMLYILNIDSAWVSVPIGFIASVSFGFTLSASLPKVGDVNLKGFSDDGVLYTFFGLVLAVITAITTYFIPLDLLFWLFIPFSAWFGYRSQVRISPRDSVYIA